MTPQLSPHFLLFFHISFQVISTKPDHSIDQDLFPSTQTTYVYVSLDLFLWRIVEMRVIGVGRSFSKEWFLAFDRIVLQTWDSSAGIEEEKRFRASSERVRCWVSPLFLHRPIVGSTLYLLRSQHCKRRRPTIIPPLHLLWVERPIVERDCALRLAQSGTLKVSLRGPFWLSDINSLSLWCSAFRTPSLD